MQALFYFFMRSALIAMTFSGNSQTLYAQEPDYGPLFDALLEQVFEPHCSICHQTGNPPETVNFASPELAYKSLVGSGDGQTCSNLVAHDSGYRRVKPGDPERSFILRKLEGPGLGEGRPMPSLHQELMPEAMQCLKDWIVQLPLDAAEHSLTPACEWLSEHLGSVLQERKKLPPMTFQDPQLECRSCHPQHVEDWQISNHAYAAKDPVFLAMVRLGQRQTKGKLGQFCVQCHLPTSFLQGQTPVQQDPTTGDFKQNFSAVDAIGHQGVSCDVCHSIQKVIEPLNARIDIRPNGIKRGPIKNPITTPAHGSEYSKLYTQGEVCAGCHNVTNPKGALIEETFREWSQSSFADENSDDPRTCQDCHMPSYRGPAAVDGPIRPLHRHTFVGVDVSLLDPADFPGYKKMRQLTQDLLLQAAELQVDWQKASGDLHISIYNRAGHALPSGATAERQMWLEVKVRHLGDTGGRVFTSGTLDQRGDLRDDNPSHSLAPGSDPYLVKFGQDLTLEQADPGDPWAHIVDMPWQADGQINKLIPAGGSSSHTYPLGRYLQKGKSYEVDVRLRFRTFPPYFLRLLEDAADLDPAIKGRLPILDMAKKQGFLKWTN